MSTSGMAPPPLRERLARSRLWLNYTDGPVVALDRILSRLSDAARALGIELTDGQLARFDQFQAALLEGNRRVNLTRITEPAEIETRHFLDSLTAAVPMLDRLRAGEAVRMVDVGSGGGMPGIPLKLAFPALRLTLVESVGKKAAFLRDVVDQLALSHVRIVAARAELAGREEDHRDAYEAAVSRALGTLPVVVELCAPFLEPGGLLIAQRSGDLEAELLAATPAFKALKLYARAPVAVSAPGLPSGRGLIVGEKYAPTPTAYPRRPGMPRKRPLA
jgi:16S rRNA (guanine527-N7)-methyltransferase